MSGVLKVIIGETFGTFMLILLGNGVSSNVSLKSTKGNSSGWIVVCVGWGLAVTIAALLSGISHAHLNPAVTIGFLVANNKGAFVDNNMAYAPLYIVCQLIGAMLGQLVVYLAYFKHFNVTDDSDLILGSFSTIPAKRSYFWNIVTEIIGTFVLIMGVSIGGGILHLTNLKPLPDFVVPVIAGITVMLIGLAIGGPTGFAINPARDLGPRIIHALLPIKNKGSSQWKYAPVPIVGPTIGACIAGGVIQIIAAI